MGFNEFALFRRIRICDYDRYMHSLKPHFELCSGKVFLNHVSLIKFYSLIPAALNNGACRSPT